MRKFVLVNIVIIFLFLISICIIEDLIVTKGVKKVNEDCMAIEELVDHMEDLRTMEVVMAVENLEYNWTKNESAMCYLVNHKSIQEIGLEISKLKGITVSVAKGSQEFVIHGNEQEHDYLFLSKNPASCLCSINFEIGRPCGQVYGFSHFLHFLISSSI